MRYYYYTLVFSCLATQKQVQKTFSDGFISVTVYEFPTWTFKVLETFWDCMGKKKSEWVVSNRCYCMLFINKSSYLPGGKSMEVRRHKEPRRDDVSIVQMSSFNSASELKDCRIISTNAIQNMEIAQ